MRAFLLLVSAAAIVVTVVNAAQMRSRALPNGWFSELIAADTDHDHSGSAKERVNHTCCHRMSFDEDPLSGEMLGGVRVPYNYWWRRGATLLSLSPTLDEPASRLLTLGDAGIELDFTQHSRLYLRLQCAFPCCLEAAEIVVPDGATTLTVLAGNATHQVDPWRLDRSKLLPPGTVAIGGGRWSARNLHEMMWADQVWTSRLDALQLCDHATTGTWIRIDSPSRIKAALTEIDVCFVHHDMVANWDTALCEENT